MRIKWSPKAKQGWYQTLYRINDEFGYYSAVKFRKETTTATNQLKKFPKSGPPEDLLASAQHEFRGILFAEYNKLIYYITEDAIHIDDIWDTRREPKNQAAETLNVE